MSIRGVILAGGRDPHGRADQGDQQALAAGRPLADGLSSAQETGRRAACSDILLVSGTEHMGDFVELLGSGRDHDCRLTYRVQDEAGGIAQALGLAELFCTGEPAPS